MRAWIHGFMMIVGTGVILGCGGGQVSPHENLASLDPLRAAFNADSGKVRAIFLASPT
jgi:hypothetical protein